MTLVNKHITPKDIEYVQDQISQKIISKYEQNKTETRQCRLKYFTDK